MASILRPRDPDGLSKWGISTEALPKFAPFKLSWFHLLPLVFAGNVAVAVLAWVIVGLVMR
jgi:hypothetical protein